MVIAARRKEEKIPVEKLQEDHLTGPANETIQEVMQELKVDQIVPIYEAPKFERVIFRNQRDPGQVHEFHYSSKTCPFKMYKLIDGHTYDLHIEVIKNLERCRENIEKYRRNSEGIPEIYIAGYKSHFVCERV